jgi:hypothetical protein
MVSVTVTVSEGAYAKSRNQRFSVIPKRLCAVGCCALVPILMLGPAARVGRAASAHQHDLSAPIYLFHRGSGDRRRKPFTRRHKQRHRHQKHLVPAVPRLFSQSSVWNAPLGDAAAVDPGSAAMVSALNVEVAREEGLGIGPWLSTGADIYVVGPHQPPVLVRLDNPNASWRASLQRAFRGVPIPTGAQPGSGADAQMTVWQPSTDRLWEFFGMRRLSDGWHAAWGGAIRKVSRNPGYYNASAWPGASTSWGATSTSLPDAAGVITLAEIKRGAINHALAVDLPYPCQGVYAWPAQRTDGTGTAANCIPEGAHLRIDPRLDIPALHLPRLVRMMAEAAQKYGMIVRNQTHWDIGFWIWNSAPTGTGPFYANGAPRSTGPFQGMWPNQLMSRFPWSAVQVLKMKLTRVSVH